MANRLQRPVFGYFDDLRKNRPDYDKILAWQMENEDVKALLLEIRKLVKEYRLPNAKDDEERKRWERIEKYPVNRNMTCKPIEAQIEYYKLRIRYIKGEIQEKDIKTLWGPKYEKGYDFVYKHQEGTYVWESIENVLADEDYGPLFREYKEITGRYPIGYDFCSRYEAIETYKLDIKVAKGEISEEEKKKILQDKHIQIKGNSSGKAVFN